MTRLDGPMPYDFEQGAVQELQLLLSELKHQFRRRIELARNDVRHSEELAEFARYCVEEGITCITFNYDDVFDEALWNVRRALTGGGPPYWHPDGGYGFFCSPSKTSVQVEEHYMDQTSMNLLKLHGSMNWYPKRGYAQPYSVDAIVHREEWAPSGIDGMIPDPDPQKVSLHLEQEPFIVPPVLVKSSVVDQPILRIVWSLAFQALERAEAVVFIGYSLPITDIGAGFLFGEALSNLPTSSIRVVNPAREVRESYRHIFRTIPDQQFVHGDARNWIKKHIRAAARR